MKVAFFAVAALLLAAWVVLASDSFKYCRQYKQSAESGQPAKEEIPHLSLAPSATGCIAYTLNTNEGATVGLATLALVVVTLLVFLATRDLVSEAGRGSRVGLRPYISVKPVSLEGLIPIEPLTYRIRVVNRGKTPALNLTFHMSRRILPFELKDAGLLNSNSDPDPPPSITLPPGKSVGAQSRGQLLPAITEDDLEALRAGKDRTGKSARLYCFGRIEYDDVFGHRHWTNYCYYSEPWAFDTADPRREAGKYGSVWCHLHNDIGTYPT